MNDVLLATLVAVVLGLGWLLSYTAARLDRLHAKVEGAAHALDAQLVRRAEATLELARDPGWDPATSLLLADLATGVLDDDGTGFTDSRVAAETALQDMLAQVLAAPPAERGLSVASTQGAWRRLRLAQQRVDAATMMHRQAVGDAVRLRAVPAVRALRLAGYAPMPTEPPWDPAVG